MFLYEKLSDIGFETKLNVLDVLEKQVIKTIIQSN